MGRKIVHAEHRVKDLIRTLKWTFIQTTIDFTAIYFNLLFYLSVRKKNRTVFLSSASCFLYHLQYNNHNINGHDTEIDYRNDVCKCVCFFVGFSLQWGHLDVVVPPDILNEADTNGSSLDESVTNEGGQIQLVCIATGVPEPTVSISMQF